MADDLSWIDHPANLRANAVLLRAIADQSLLHADEIERLNAELNQPIPWALERDLRAEIERLRAENAMLRDAILKSDDAHWTPAMRAALTTGERDD
jgi:uncharacterized small protein (DUF1192 family)